MEDDDQDRLKVQAPVLGIYFLVLDRSIINIYHIIYYYIIKIGPSLCQVTSPNGRNFFRFFNKFIHLSF